MGIFKAGMVQCEIVVTRTNATDRGTVIAHEDVLAFVNTDIETGKEGAAIYKCDVTRADKKTGTGYDIAPGQKLYVDLSDSKVSPTKSAGYLFCGWAQEEADGADETVKMEFDGRWSTVY